MFFVFLRLFKNRLGCSELRFVRFRPGMVLLVPVRMSISGRSESGVDYFLCFSLPFSLIGYWSTT